MRKEKGGAAEPTFLDIVLSLLYYPCFFSGAVLTAGFAALGMAFAGAEDKHRRFAHRIASAFGDGCVNWNRHWNCSIENEHHLPHIQGPVIFVANHQSMADVLFLCRIKHHFKWICKTDVARFPGIGLHMWLNRYISVNPRNPKSIRAMMQQASAYLQDGVSLFIFPEGARSQTGEMLPFRDGPFRLACSNNVPIIPVVLDGTHGVLPRGELILRFNGDVRLKVLPAVDPAKFQYDQKRLKTYVETLMRTELELMRSEVFLPHANVANGPFCLLPQFAQQAVEVIEISPRTDISA